MQVGKKMKAGENSCILLHPKQLSTVTYRWVTFCPRLYVLVFVPIEEQGRMLSRVK